MVDPGMACGRTLRECNDGKAKEARNNQVFFCYDQILQVDFASSLPRKPTHLNLNLFGLACCGIGKMFTFQCVLNYTIACEVDLPRLPCVALLL